MNDRQLEKLLKRVEVPISMQQRVAVAQAEYGDQAVDRLTNRVAPRFRSAR